MIKVVELVDNKVDDTGIELAVEIGRTNGCVVEAGL